MCVCVCVYNITTKKEAMNLKEIKEQYVGGLGEEEGRNDIISKIKEKLKNISPI